MEKNLRVIVTDHVLHAPVVLGQLDAEDDAGGHEEHTPAQGEPEPILKRATNGHITHFFIPSNAEATFV